MSHQPPDQPSDNAAVGQPLGADPFPHFGTITPAFGSILSMALSHNPRLDWEMGTFLQWGVTYHHSCLKQALSPHLSSGPATEPLELMGVSAVYNNLSEIFIKAWATSLSPHRSYCAINLLPGTALPKGRLYSLSEP